MPLTRRFCLGALLVLPPLLSACVGFRETLPPSREGSMSNVVEYGYFTTGLQSPLGWYFKPLAYRHFNIDNDERVIFVGVVQNPGPAYVLRGVLRRPDSTRHADFRREVGASHPLSRSTYYMSQEFAMKDLKGFPGDWSLELFIDDAQVGAFSFFLGDARAITQARKRRAE